MKRLLLGLYPFLVISICSAGQRGVPPSCGIVNFGCVDQRVYRGAQPDEAGLASLKELGIKTIINLRMANDVLKTELGLVEKNSMVYTNVPMTGIGRPTDEQIHLILSLIESLPSPVFIHCEHGCDRTGTIVACYRIKHEGWSATTALQEAKTYGLSFFERGMRSYIVDFAKSAKSNDTLLSKK
jgi:protein tyrosine/serine phosphatase